MTLGVPDAIAPAAAERRPITLVSGLSATSDIDRVEGVPSPRTLDVLVVHRSVVLGLLAVDYGRIAGFMG
jgi:hypothetical protein